MLEKIIYYFFPCLINLIAGIYVISRLLNKKISFKSYKIYLVMGGLEIIGLFNFLYISNFLRLIFITVAMFVANYILFREKFKVTLVSTLTEQIIVVVSEMIYALIIAISNINNQNISFVNNFFGTLLTNTIIAIIMLIIIQIPLVHKLYDKLLKITNKINTKLLCICAFLILIPINILVFMGYEKINTMATLLINIIFILLYFAIMMAALNEKNENIKYKQENESLLTDLSNYERIIDCQRISSHENKNQLLVIKSMIKEKDESVLDYIDEVIKTDHTDNEVLLTKVKRIPAGGLQGLIYQKLLLSQEKGIVTDLNISKDILRLNFKKMSSRLNFDMCKAVGVIFDNAIEEVDKGTQKEISVTMYSEEEKFIIEISNYCDTIPDLNEIDNPGYTTKEKGHGYGLVLLKQIVESNDCIENQRSIVKNIFCQIIKIKM